MVHHGYSDIFNENIKVIVRKFGFQIEFNNKTDLQTFLLTIPKLKLFKEIGLKVYESDRNIDLSNLSTTDIITLYEYFEKFQSINIHNKEAV